MVQENEPVLTVRLRTDGTYHVTTEHGAITTTSPNDVEQYLNDVVAWEPAGTTRQLTITQPGLEPRHVVFTSKGPGKQPTAKPGSWLISMSVAMVLVSRTRTTPTPEQPANRPPDAQTTRPTGTPSAPTAKPYRQPVGGWVAPPRAKRTGEQAGGPTRASKPTPKKAVPPPAPEVPAPAQPAAQPAPAPFIPDSVRAEHAQTDKGLDVFFTFVLPLLVFALPAINATISPAVREEGGSWFGLFLATMALSLGVGICVYIASTGAARNIPGIWQLAGAGAILAGSSLIAASLGVGALDNPLPCKVNPNTPITGRDAFCPDYRATAIVYIAEGFRTFGPLGAILGAASGAIGGNWAARIYKQNH